MYAIRSYYATQQSVLGVTFEESLDVLPVIGIQLSLDEIGRRAHRSISPNTMSSEPRIADTSASM